jgi:probable phosphoglycerate mutase
MRITMIVVRHGHVEGIDVPRFRGRIHLSLTASGLQQAEQAGEYVRRLAPHPAVIYSSPLTRCVTTASIIGNPFGLAPVPNEGLNDIDYGSWQGRLVSEVTEEDPSTVAKWFRSPAEAEIPGGETLRALADRVRATVDEIVSTNAGNAVVLVAHDSVNRAILLQALGLPLNHYWRLGQSPGAVSHLEYLDGEWTVESLNETAHLIPSLGHRP